MISVLIPFYNWDVTGLLEDLLISARQVSGDMEIIVCDDHSADSDYFRKLSESFADEKSLIFIRNVENLGRSRTRNYLTSMAKFDYVIFIDGDSRLSQPESYLMRYTQTRKEDHVIVGGTLYDKLPPPEPHFRLHWKYGRNRESKPSEFRNKEPLRYFFSNNFACAKSVLLRFPFDEKITGYGYEDSLWAEVVMHAGLKISHIDNYVIHKGLKSNGNFLKDANEALHTLTQWSLAGRKSHVSLFMYYHRLRKSFIGKIILYLVVILHPLFRKILESGQANLRVFDLYRLGVLSANLKKHVIEKISKT